MIRARCFLVPGLALALAVLLPALSGQDKAAKEKSPGDIAAEAYYKIRDERDAPVSSERLQKLLTSGIGFLAEYPGHGRASSVISSLASFAGTMKDKKHLPLVAWWQNQLKYEALDRRMREGASEEQRLVWYSLETAVAGQEARQAPGRDQLAAFREKIDRLAEQPGASRFLSGHERDFLLALGQANPAGMEAQAKKLLEHKDKRVVAVAREELNLIQARRTPLEFKFTGLDGKETDASTLRGKAVLVFFWSTDNENSLKDLDELSAIHRTYKLEFEIITVCLNAEAGREKVLLAAKKLKWPVCFDGRGRDHPLAVSLNVRNAPAGFLFGKTGLLVAHGLRANKVEGELKKVLGVK